VIKNIESHTIRYDTLLYKVISSSDRASTGAVDESITQIFQRVIRTTEQRIHDFVKGHHFDMATFAESLKAYKEAEDEGDQIQRLVEMDKVCHSHLIIRMLTAFRFSSRFTPGAR
jgi:hypothetical protein